MKTVLDPCEQWIVELRQQRRGVFVVVMAVTMVACLAFVAFSVDTGMVVLTQTRMQNCVDAAALAAANEIGYAVEHAGSNVTNVTQYAMDQSRLKAQSIAALNGVHVDPATDVRFGRWNLNASTGVSSITWDVTPANAVQVNARRTNSDTSQADGQLKTLFAGVFGTKAVSITTSATAYIESRDIALSIDFSGSMNDDSTFASIGLRSQTSLESNMQDIFNILGSVRNLGTMTFTPQWYQQTLTSGGKNGTATFKNNAINITTSAPLSSVVLTYSGSSTTDTRTVSGSSVSLNASSTSKTITAATVTIPGTLAPTTGTGSSSGKSSTVVFNNNSGTTITDTTSSGMTEIVLYYADGTNSTFTFTSTTSKSVTGDTGKYVTSARAKIGTTYVTVNNPAGSTEPSTFATQTLNFVESTANIQNFLGLANVTYPWASGSWSSFISYCQTDSTVSTAGYKRKYGGANLVNYLLTKAPAYSQCNDLWRTPHYPFHSVKQGAMLMCDFLGNLGFGDEIGAVCYATTARRETGLNYDGYNIDLSANPVCGDFASVRQIINHRQASHYDSSTNTGAGIYCARQMLDASKRAGTRPTILVMTDGLPTAQDSGWTFPSNWDWDKLFDYDGNGVRDFYTTDSNAMYGLMRAKEAVDAGYTIHTMTVGLGGDPAYMKAIAHLGGGITITVPGNQTVAEMEADVLAGFQKIAAFVPPARLVKPD